MDVDEGEKEFNLQDSLKNYNGEKFKELGTTNLDDFLLENQVNDNPFTNISGIEKK